MSPLRSLRQRSCGCCLLVVLVFLLLVVGLVFLIVRAARAETLPPAYDVVLVSDQSPSMWDCDGIGTDPELLRVDAARLFITTLGADSSAHYRLAVLHFGGEVSQVAGLTDLADPQARERLLEAVSQPQAIRWTDQWLALETARRLLNETGAANSRRLILLLTDGEPAPMPRLAENLNETDYLAKLQAATAGLATEGITLVVVLLGDVSTSCGRAVAATWAERWASLAEQTPRGGLYTAHQAADLLPIYHAIVRELTGAADGAAASTILQPDQPFSVPVIVEKGVAGLVITVWKAEAATTVEVRDPQGQPATAGSYAVTIVGGGGQREQVWRVNQPQPGPWQVTLTGRGRVSVWHDRILATPTPTTTPSPTATPLPTATASATPVATPTSRATSPPTTTATLTAIVGSTTLPGRSQSPRWPWALAGGALTGISALVVVGMRRRGPYLTGQLTPLETPEGSDLLLPLDLGRLRCRQVTLGRGGRSEWRLSAWSGSLRLAMDRLGGVMIVPVTGELTVDDRPARAPQPLADGAMIGCGAYRFRYENLLR